MIDGIAEARAWRRASAGIREPMYSPLDVDTMLAAYAASKDARIAEAYAAIRMLFNLYLSGTGPSACGAALIADYLVIGRALAEVHAGDNTRPPEVKP